MSAPPLPPQGLVPAPQIQEASRALDSLREEASFIALTSLRDQLRSRSKRRLGYVHPVLEDSSKLKKMEKKQKKKGWGREGRKEEFQNGIRKAVVGEPGWLSC